MSLISGRKILLNNPDIEVLHLPDIAHSLGNICRFNGHVDRVYTVLQHSLVACMLSDKEHKMEALLHDAGEAYIGDIIVPVKELFPEIARYEDGLTGLIFKKFAPKSERIDPITGHYVKSPYLKQLDVRLARGESFILRPCSPERYDPEVEAAMLRVARARPQDFLDMYERIKGDYI